MQVVFTTSRRA